MRTAGGSPRRAWLAYALVALVACATGPAHADWQTFRSSDQGLAHDRVLSILEDHDGAMWFGTLNGASRFDGQTWTTERAHLPNPPVVTAMVQEAAGDQWFGTERSGVVRFTGAGWRTYDSLRYLPATQVTALFEDHAGELWIGTIAGLVRVSATRDRWTPYAAGPGGLVHNIVDRIAEDGDHHLWVGTPYGASEFDSTRTVWRSYGRDAAALASDSVLALCAGDDGSMWFGTDSAAFRFDGDRWTAYRVADGLGRPPVNAIARDGRGGLWFGGAGGLSHFDGRVWRRFETTDRGDSLGEIQELDVDRSGNVWIATVGHALFRYDGVTWRNVVSYEPGFCRPPPDAVPHVTALAKPSVQAMLQVHEGDLWVATLGGGLDVLARSDRTWRPVRRADDVPVSDSVRVLFEDSRGALWCGSRFAGLARLDSTRTGWTLYTAADGLPGDSVSSMAEDHEGRVWVGTGNGAGRLDGTAWTPYLRGHPAGRQQIDRIVVDTRDRVWLQATRGVYRVDAPDAEPVRVTVGDGLPDTVATVMLAGASGRVYVGTRRGLAILDAQDHWTVHATIGAPGESTITALLEDDQGRLWAGGQRGVGRLDGTTWTHAPYTVLGAPPVRALLEDAAHTIWAVMTNSGVARFDGTDWRRYSSAGNGLVSDDVSAMLEDSQGHLWFASPCGATEYAPDRVAPQSLVAAAPAPVVPVDRVHFVFGAGYGESADLEFSVEWDGHADDTWSPSVTWDREAIPDGLHTLRVRARDWVHNEDPTPAAVTFEVAATPPTAILASPTFGQAVQGTCTLRGTATDPRYRAYRVERRSLGAESWGDSAVTPADTVAVRDGVLATWDTRSVRDGLYDVRLVVSNTLGLLGTAQTTVMVDNEPPFANATAPRPIPAGGGDVYSILGDVHLYLPPGSITPGDSVFIVPATGPGAGTGAAVAHSIAWQGVLRKPAVLEMTPDSATAHAGGALGIARFVDGAWGAPIGGTREPASGRLAVPIDAPGTYGIVVATAPATGAPLSGVSLSPRALSLSGGYGGGAGIAIGFRIGRPAYATVRIYNRAGHFVREVASGVSLNAGANVVRWDGRDAGGERVREGLYLVSIEALGEVQTRTVAVVP